MSSTISKTRVKRSKKINKSSSAERPSKRGFPLSWLFLGTLMWLSAIVLIYGGGTFDHLKVALGQKAPSTVIAAVNFKTVDVARTREKHLEAAASVPPVFTIQMRHLNTDIRSLEKLFQMLGRFQNDAALNQNREALTKSFHDLLELTDLSLSAKEIQELLTATDLNHVWTVIQATLQRTWENGLVSTSDKDTAFKGLATRGLISVLKSTDVPPLERELKQLFTPEEILPSLVQTIQGELSGTKPSEKILAQLLGPYIVPNLHYDEQSTSERRSAALRAVEPVLMHIREGTILVEKNEPVTKQILEQLRAHELRLKEMETVTERSVRVLGNGGLLFLALMICSGIMRRIKPDLMYQPSNLLLLVLLSLLTLLPSKALLYLSSSTRLIPPGLVEFMLPLALAPLLATILLGGTMAIVLGFWTSFSTAVLFDNSFVVFVLGLISTVAAARYSRDVVKRSRVFRAGLLVGTAGILCTVSLAALNQPAPSVIALQALAVLVTGLLCSFLTLLLLPLFEYLFGITTDITLLEHSDMGNPLLQRLAIEAPGTYHHSLMVSNLGQAAASEIGAHALKVRVCAYYHDIGKLTKPEFFTENVQQQNNPHDDLAPSMSTLVIIAHVKEGVSLAKQYKLPRPIIDGIQQHHGTSLISYFYHRAKQQHASKADTNGGAKERELDEQDYRYEGPRPSSKEMGILLLADSVEASSRCMDKPTSSRIESLVNEIVDARLLDGQLDNCHLTISEISAIKKSFVFTLTSMLHGRVAYPKDESRLKQSAGELRTEPAANKEAHAVAHDTSSAA